MKIIGLIPARKGSKRVPGKNMALLNGKSLLQYAIDSAKESEVFSEILVSTDWGACIDLAAAQGVNAIRRPDELCEDLSHDYEWVRHALDSYRGKFDIFMILRPTSPFRTAATIERALRIFLNTECDSMRAVDKTRGHPRKSWQLAGDLMNPYLNGDEVNGFPAFDMATQALGDIYCQNGCIHAAWVGTLKDFGNVSGRKIAPFFTKELEGIDINTTLDLMFAGWIMRGMP